MSLEEKMKEKWKEVKKMFYYPNLADPVFSEESPTAGINTINKQISINEKFVEKCHEKGVSYDDTLKGLLAHEAAHHMVCPFDLKRLLKINAAASDIDEEQARLTTAFYTDLAVNLELTLNRDMEEISKLIAIKPNKTDLSRLEKAYFQEMTGHDMGIEVDEKLKAYLQRMKAIDFFDKTNEKNNVKRMARLIKEVIENDPNFEQNKQEAEGYQTLKPESYTKNEIEKALRELAQESKEDFEKAVKSFGLLPTHDEGNPKQATNLFYYQKLAENCAIKLKKKQLKTNGSQYPYSHKPFEIDDSPQNIDVFNSFGKPFIPGLGKSWIKKDGEAYGHQEDVPNAIVIIDSSGSMADPESQLSYAVLGGICAANTYLENKQEVAVVNFSKEAVVSQFSRNKNQVHRDILMHQGGGTVYNNEFEKKLEKLIESSEKDPDVILITDLEIDGRERMFEFLHNNKNRNRVTILYTGGLDKQLREMQEKFNDDNFSLYAINSPESIPKIIIGEVNKSIK